MEHQFAPSGMKVEEAEKVSAMLQTRLADLIDLSLTLKHIHWNVNGVGFMAVHELMDQQTGQVRDLVDEVAERITTLGGIAAGLTQQVSDFRTADADYSLGRAPVMAHLGALDKVYERVIAGHRDATYEVVDLDSVSEDLLIGQTAKLDLYHWFVRAHLEDTAGHLPTSDAQDELEAAVAAAQSPGLEAMEANNLEKESVSVN